MSMEQRALPQSVEGGSLVSVYSQSKCMSNDFMPASPTSSFGYFTDPYPVTTFTAAPSIFQMPFLQRTYQLGIPPPPLIATKEERQKRKRCLNQSSARKSLRRDSSSDSKANTATGGRGTGPSNRPCGTDDHHSSEHLNQQGKSHHQHTKESNRTAAGKYRVKKREYMLRVLSQEQELEQTNHDLSTGVAHLTRDVQELKMKLLQHTNCDCSLIHEYLAVEVQRYVDRLSKRSQLEAISPGAVRN
jgi:hypothetical protein